MSDLGPQLEEIFDAVLVCPPENRAARLAELCGDNAVLKDEVSSLLAVADKVHGFLSISPLNSTIDDPGEPEKLIGKQVGAYRLLGVLGVGGMATVYLAERADGHYQQQVAIKVVRNPLAGQSARGRFHIERQILAKLEHPNIARLLDGGTFAGDGSYLVMEYVRGEPIDAYCESQRLCLLDTIQLFCAVCRAVQYAHQHLIVHRDLKPGNIFVTRDGTPKLLDFGIAKLLDPFSIESDEFTTVTGNFLMTVEYASPEQVTGDPITTATDVYTLGVILFQLLTRRMPYDLSNSNLAALTRTLCEVEPPVPSTLVTPPLRARMRGDLDNIVLQALNKEPQLRYAQVQGLVDDLENFLAGRAVNASRPTRVYRLRKFLKRNLLPVALAAFSAFVLVAGTLTTAWQALIAQQEHQRAERHAAEIREITNTIVFKLPAAIKNLPGSTELRRRLLEQGLAYLDYLHAERSQDPELLRELATAYYELATVQGSPMFSNLGDPSSAIANFHKSLKINQVLLARFPDDEKLITSIAKTYQFLSSAPGFAGRLEEARALNDQCIRLLEPAASRAQSFARLNLVSCYTVAAHWDNALERYEKAEINLRKAQKIYSPNLEDPGSRMLGRIYEELASTAAGKNDYATALKFERKRLAIATETEGEGRESRRLADTYHGFAARLSATGRRQDAQRAYEQAIQLWRTRAKDDPRDSAPPQALAGIYAELAKMEHELSDAARKNVEKLRLRNKACDDIQRSRQYLQQLKDPSIGFGARYPWLPSLYEFLKHLGKLCVSKPASGVLMRTAQDGR